MSLPTDVDVAVVGAGAAGLATAAALRRTDMDVLVLDQASKPAASWRRRYDGLRLNSVRWMSDLRPHRLDRRCGNWPTRDDWISYLERYAAAQELPIRGDTVVFRIDRDGSVWLLRTSRGDLRCAHVVVATGRCHTPVTPPWPGVETFAGRLIHSSEFRDAAPFRDLDTVVVGGGNSACDIAALLADDGSGSVSVSLRTPPLFMKREYFGIPITALGWLARPAPQPALDLGGRILQRVAFGDLAEHGLGPPGHALSELRRGHYVPTVDSGFVAAVKRGAIRVIAPIQRFDGVDIELLDGRTIRPDAVIAATGFRPALEALVGHLDVLNAADGLPRVHGGQCLAHAVGMYFVGYKDGLTAVLPTLWGQACGVARMAAASSGRDSTAAWPQAQRLRRLARKTRSEPDVSRSRTSSAAASNHAKTSSSVPEGPRIRRRPSVLRKKSARA